MFGSGRRRRRERDEFAMLHAKIAAIHGDLIRRDEELIGVLDRLATVAERSETRMEGELSLASVFRQMLEVRDAGQIDLATGPRVLGGSVEPVGADEAQLRA